MTDHMKYLRNGFSKAWQVADAFASRGFMGHKVSEEARDIRDISCHGSEELGIPPCEARMDSEKYANSYYCGECNCGDFSHTQLVNLDENHYSKQDYPRAYCPRSMPGFSNFVPLNISEKDMRKHLIQEAFGVDYLNELNGEQK
jgi:hypothetical protein